MSERAEVFKTIAIVLSPIITLGAVLVALFRDELRRFLLNLRLLIDYGVEKPFVLPDGRNGLLGQRIRVQIRNPTRIPAKDLRVVIDGIELPEETSLPDWLNDGPLYLYGESHGIMPVDYLPAFSDRFVEFASVWDSSASPGSDRRLVLGSNPEQFIQLSSREMLDITLHFGIASTSHAHKAYSLSITIAEDNKLRILPHCTPYYDGRGS